MQFLSYFKKNRWSPYIVGVLIGLLAWVVFGYMKESIGVSTTFVRAIILIENGIWPEHVSQLSYFKEILSNGPLIDWQFAFVVGIFFGSLLAAFLARSFNTKSIPHIWGMRFGYSKTKRLLGSFLGGALLMFGARLAGGCTSGHGISGGMLLAVSGWIFIVAAFSAGIIFSLSFYRSNKKNRKM